METSQGFHVPAPTHDVLNQSPPLGRYNVFDADAAEEDPAVAGEERWFVSLLTLNEK